nr:hypothetical protein [uncultured Treponema sp.]
MKKLLCFVLGLFLSFSVFAKGSFKNVLGVGFTLPVSSVNYSGDVFNKSISQIGVGGDVMWLGTFIKNGLTFKVNLSPSFLNSSDMDDYFSPAKKNFCVDALINLGAGYSFIRSEKYVLALLGMVGISTPSYTYSNGSSEINIMSINFCLGLDLVGYMKINDNFGGLFISLGFRYEPSMSGKITTKLGSSTISEYALSSSVFKFIPTIGFTF